MRKASLFTGAVKMTAMLAVMLLVVGCADDDDIGGSETDPCAFSKADSVTVTYATRGNNDLLMDIKWPKGSGPWPAAMYIHAGGWRQGSGKTYGTVTAGNTRNDPYVVVGINPMS